MFVKSLAAGLAATTMLAGVAFAQAPTPMSDRANSAASSTSSTSESLFKGDWRASKMSGLKVYNEKNENVGSINDLLMDKAGNVKEAVISVGGVLGVGARYVTVPYDKIKFVNEPVPMTGTADNSTAPKSTTTTGAATTNAPATSSKPNPWYPDHAVYNASEDELKAMPEFKYSNE